MAANNILIRSGASDADLPDVLNLLETCELTTEGIAEYLKTALLVREGEKLIGCAALELYGEAALLRSVAVAPDMQHKGIGRALVEAALTELAPENGVQRVYLLTETAPNFFAGFGFQLINRTQVEPAVQESIEFTEACPDSALAMRLDLAN